MINCEVVIRATCWARETLDHGIHGYITVAIGAGEARLDTYSYHTSPPICSIKRTHTNDILKVFKAGSERYLSNR